MRTKALMCFEPQRFGMETVEIPNLNARDIQVKTLYSGVSVGTEFALINNKISWGPYPLVTGYQAVGEVIDTGESVSEYKIGDQVYFRDNRQLNHDKHGKVSAVSGTHSQHATINIDTTHGVDHLPEGVDHLTASHFVLPAVGLNGVDQAKVKMGDVVLVNGCGMIGLGVIGALAPRGCTIVACDLDDKKLESAELMGADYIINVGTKPLSEVKKELTNDGFDVTFECTGLGSLITPCVEVTRSQGTFVWQGNYGSEPLSFDFLPAHGRKLTMVFPCDDGLAVCRRAVLKNMRSGALPWHKLISHTVKASDSPDFFAEINAGKSNDVVGAVIDWS